MVLALAVATLAGVQADAQSWQSGYSTIVVDAKTGRVVQANEADTLRHPASLAKIMTLYLLFSEIESGRLRLSSPIKISTEAAGQPPSKLGLAAGQTIKVEDAIRAIVTRSANDIAVAVAEAISGDHQSFARLMTNRAHALGMRKTVFRNASGLPDRAQITTARDMALLALAIQDRFPKLYPYFATRTFRWRGVNIGNHNRLLGSFAGVDGIKTGYTRASGFNLVTNVVRGERHIVAVVLGGRTGAARDDAMRNLITENIRHASTGPRTAPRFAESTPLPVPNPKSAAAVAPPEPGSGEPIQRRQVPTVAVTKGGKPAPEGDKPPREVLAVAALAPASVGEPMRITPSPPTAIAAGGKRVTFAPPPPPALVPSASAQESPEVDSTSALAGYAASEPARAAAPAAASAAAASVSAPTASPPPGAWIIQIGAFNAEAQARERLDEARSQLAGAIGAATPYTERTTRGSTEFVRARFAGFDEAGAKRACATLQRRNFACLAMRN
jgi:D-alanyl-D-alanine carboxypeptidase